MSMHQTLANITTGSFWKQLQYHKQRGIALARRHGRSRERQRRVQPPTKTWMFSVQWGYTFPSLFNSRTSGQYLVRPSLLEIVLSRGMRSHCCIQRWWKQVWALGTGAVHLHFSWAERKSVSHFMQTKPVRPISGQCGRYCCRYKCSLLSSVVFLTHDGIFWALPGICCKDALYKRNTVWRAAQLLLPCTVLAALLHLSAFTLSTSNSAS